MPGAADPVGDLFLRAGFALPTRPDTFLNDWAAGLELSVAWLTAEAADHAPGLFRASVWEALRVVGVPVPHEVDYPAEASRVDRRMPARLAVELEGRDRPVVLVSGVDEEESSEAGGLPFTARNLGSALGITLIGSLLIAALAHAFTPQVEGDRRLPEGARRQTGVAPEAGITFVPTGQVRSAAERAGLKAAILATGGITPAGFLVAPHLPSGRGGGTQPLGSAAPSDAPGATR